MTLLADMFPLVLHHLWQAGLIALVLAAGYAALRSQPGMRLALGLAAFALAALLPLATFLPDTSLAGEFGPTAAFDDVVPDPGDDAEFIDTGAPLLQPALKWGRMAGQGVLVVMLVLSALLLIRTAIQAVAAERLRSAARALPLPETIAPRFSGIDVRTHPDVGGPMVVGIARPAVLLPDGFTASRSDAALAAILEHECAHVRRLDPAIALVQKLVMAVFWWNPALHWISSRIDRDREMACDAEAVRRSGSARALAITLADEAEARLTGRLPALAVGVMDDPSELRRRIDALLTPPKGRRRIGLAAPVLLLVGAGVAAWATPKASFASGTESVRILSYSEFSSLEAALGEALVSAAMNHDIAAVQALIEEGAPIDYAQPGDGTALIEAARTGDMTMARYLINHGADVDLGVSGDGNPLIMAAAHKKFDMVRLLVEAGADVNAYVPGDETPLINAARNGKVDLVRYLVENGSDVNLAMWTNLEWEPEFRSPLWGARESGNAELIAYLESRGAVHEPSARP